MVHKPERLLMLYEGLICPIVKANNHRWGVIIDYILSLAWLGLSLPQFDNLKVWIFCFFLPQIWSLIVEVLFDILREHRHKVICNPDFAMDSCDVLDLTTNVRYEVQGYDVSGKLRTCPENTVIIPILKYYNDRFRDYIVIYVIV